MPMYFPPWDADAEPSESNIKIWMDNLYGKYEPLEQARWNQANIDSLFYAGEQRFINSYFNFYPAFNAQTFQFNLIQQPINMVTGYQRQHRKAPTYTPIEGSDQQNADDLTKLVTYANNYRGILEKFSKACELSAISGLVLLQPYLDFTDDPVNGTLDARVWAYNEFMIDPYFRESNLSDCNFVWCQQYVSKREAKKLFPHKADLIDTMSGFGNRNGKFYFLPENYNLARHDLIVMSYIWYQSKRKKKMLYNLQNGMTYDYGEKEEYLEELVDQTRMFEIIEVEVPTWKQAVVCNEQMMSNNYNPLGFDECPFIPVFWNYDPHVAQYDLRVRSLTRSMRDTQFLLNRRIVLNHDISESSINSGWMRKENSVVNEDDLRYSGQGKDIIIKEGYELTDVQKIIPNAVPPSDMELANQLADFIFRTSGINEELMGMADDDKAGVLAMLRQGAGLVTLQKYFDQWDIALKLLGALEQKIIQNNWSVGKMQRILGKEPSPEFLNKTFSKYDVLVSEGVNTTIQQQMQFRQLLELNEITGGAIPTRFLIENATIQGKDELIKAIDEQQAQAAEMQKQQSMLEAAFTEAKLQEMTSRAASNLAMARERHGRAESNVGLFEERLSQITHNRALALKDKVEALSKLLESFAMYGSADVMSKMGDLSALNQIQELDEDKEEAQAHAITDSNKFLTEMMQKNVQPNNMQESGNVRSALL